MDKQSKNFVKKEYQKEYQKQYYQKVKTRKPYVIKVKTRKPYVIKQPPPPQPVWATPEEEGQLLDTKRYIFYENKIWSKHILKYLTVNNWASYNIYDKNDAKIRLKKADIKEYIAGWGF